MIKTRTGEWSPNSPFMQRPWSWVNDSIAVSYNPDSGAAIFTPKSTAKVSVDSFTYQV